MLVVGCLFLVAPVGGQQAVTEPTGVLEPQSTVNSSVVEQTDEYVLTASDDGTVRASAPNGTELWTFDSPSNSVAAVAVSPDGSSVFTGGTNGSVHAIDAESGAHVERFAPSGTDILDLAIDSDGETIYVSYEDDAGTSAVDIDNGTVDWSVNQDWDDDMSVSLSPDDATVYVGQQGGDLTAHDAADGTVEWSVTHRNDVSAIVVHPDGHTVYTASQDQTVRAIDAQTGATRWAYGGLDAGVNSVEIGPDGHLLFAGGSGGVHAIDAHSGVGHWQTGVSNSVTDLVVDPDRTTLRVAQSSGEVTSLDPASGSVEALQTPHIKGIRDSAYVGEATSATTGTVEGTVTDGSGDPVEDARVFLYETTDEAPVASTTTDATGTYSITHDTGTYTLEATAWQQEATTDVTLEADVSVTANLTVDGIADATSDLLYTVGTDNAVVASDASSLDSSLPERWQFDGHSSSVRAVAAGPDDETVFSGGDDGTVRAIDADSGVQRAELSRAGKDVTDLALASDGETLYASHEDDVPLRAIDVETGNVRWTKNTDWDDGLAVAVSPDGSTVYAGQQGGDVLAHDAADGSIEWSIQHRNDVTDIVVHPDGHTVYTTSTDQTVRAIDAQTGTTRWAYGGFDTGVSNVEMGPEGHLVFAGGGSQIHAVDAHAGVGHWQTGTATGVRGLTVDADRETLVVGLNDGDVQAFDPTDGSPAVSLPVHSNTIAALTYVDEPTPTETGSVAGTVTDGSGDPVEDARVFLYETTDEAPVASTTTDADGSYAITHDTGTYTLEATAWQQASTTDLTVEADGSVTANLTIDGIADAKSDLLYTVGTDNAVVASDASTSESSLPERWQFDGHSSSVRAVAAGPDDETVFSGGDDGTVRAIDAESGVQLGELSRASVDVTDLALASDGETLYASHENDVPLKAIDVETGNVRWTKNTDWDDGLAVAVSPDGSTVYAGQQGGEVLAHDAADGSIEWSIDHRGDVTDIVVHPDGHTVYTNSQDQTVRAIDAQTGTTRWAYGGFNSGVSNVEMGPDGHLVFAGGASQVHAVDAHAGVGHWQTGTATGVRGLTVDADRETLVVGLNDGDVQVLDPTDGSPAVPLPVHSNTIAALTYVDEPTPTETGSVAGTVTDGSGDPVEDARVFLYETTDEAPVASTTTNDTGGYTITHDTGTYTLEATAWQQASTTDVTVEADESIATDLTITGIQAAQTESLYSASADNSVRAFGAGNHSTGPLTRWRFNGHTSSVRAVEPGPNGAVVFSGGDDGTVRAIDADSGVQLGELSRASVDVTDLALASDGETLYASHEDDVPLKAIDVETGNVRWTKNTDWDDGLAVAVSPDGSTVYAGQQGGDVIAHDAADGSITWDLTLDASTTAIDVSPDSAVVYVSTTDGTVTAIDSTTGTESWNETLGANIEDVFVASDGETIYTGGGQSISALDAENGSIDWTNDVGQSVTQLEMDADDGVLIAGLSDGRYLTVDPADGTPSTDHDIHDGRVTDIEYIGTDGTVSAVLTATPETPTVGEPVTFDASDSVGSIATYQWDFGDGTTTETADPTASHTYEAAGTYDATLTVTDGDGTTDSANVSVSVEVTTESVFAIELGEVPERVDAGETVSADATIENIGNEAGSDTVTLLANGTVVDEVQTGELAPNETESVSLSWETTDDEAGDNTLTLATSDDDVQTTVTVTRPPTFEIPALESNSPVLTGETLLVNATIENGGTVAGNQSVALEIGDEVVDTRTISLDGGARTSVQFNWTADTAGNLTASVSTSNETASLPVTVEKPTRFPVSIEATNAPVEVGNALNATITVANDGANRSNASVDVALGGDVTANRTLDLAAGTTQSVTVTLGTANLDAGTHDLVVATADDHDTTTVELEAESGGGGGGGIVLPPPTEPADPAEFAITELSVPDEVDTGDSIGIDVTVENVGGESGSETVSIDVAGDEAATESVTLDAGETATVSTTVSVPANSAGETIEIATEAGEDTATASVQVRENKPSVVLDDVTMPSTAEPDENVTATATVTNDGSWVITETIAYEIDGFTVATSAVELESGTSETVELTGPVPTDVDRESVSQTVSVHDETTTESLEISTDDDATEPPESGTDDSIPGFGLVAALFALTLVAVRLRQ
ncbi:PQQ-binding-like beta-propeller repeat protein [Halovivax limisalsi]|uniref:outer membrane protein assembly factor BamB family protein n=1 Tax=Halovivax limisalsi TaxID=1453760 RepID=UPI001FFD1B80|nr:PQQ-binding-like beta-propeller repeat protein [Halovivax limisalsi]